MTGISKLTHNAIASIEKAKDSARELNSSVLLVEHLFLGLIQVKKGVAAKTLADFGIDIDKTYESVKEEILSKNTPKEDNDKSANNVFTLDVSEDFQSAIQNAFRIALELHHVYVGTEHLLLGILLLKDLEFVKKLSDFNINYVSVKEKIMKIAQYPAMLQGEEARNEAMANAENRPFDKTNLSGKDKAHSSILEIMARDMTEMAQLGQLDPVIGREKEIDRMIAILARRSKNNPILIGDAGVGKTAIVEGLAQLIASGKAPRIFSNFRIWSIDTAAIVAGSQMRGDVEGKVLSIIEEIEEKGNVILFIDEIHTILGAGAGGQNSLDIANMLKPALSKGKLRLIGATTQTEYSKHFENDPALTRRFQPVSVDEVSVDAALKIMDRVATVLEVYHGVRITKDAIEQAVKLSERYITDRFLPDKAIDLIDEACAKKHLDDLPVSNEVQDLSREIEEIIEEKENAVLTDNYDKAVELKEKEEVLRDELHHIEQGHYKKVSKKKNTVTEEDIRNVVSQWTGVPVTSLTSDDVRAIKNLDKNLRSRIIGQNNAVEAVANAVKRARTGIINQTRPLASLLFLGPTGVGKSELAKSLAQSLFGDKDALIQVDMSEMMEPHSVSKFIGAPPGYVGFDYGGQLTEKVRKKPYAVILFDELEKAHPDVLNILLQILEDGRLTDGRGRAVNFRNTVIIMTSNIGASEIGKDDSLGFKLHDEDDVDEESLDDAYDDMKERILDELKEELAPEFINRIDEIVIFKSLTKADVRKIVDLQVDELNQRLKDKNLYLDISHKLRSKVAKDGYSDEYGARPVKRKIQELIESKVSDYLLSHRHIKKMTQLTMDLVKDKVTIKA